MLQHELAIQEGSGLRKTHTPPSAIDFQVLLVVDDH